MTEPSRSLEGASVAALLARYRRAERASLFDELVDTLSGLMPGVRVERTLFRRRVMSVHVPVGDFVYALARDDHDGASMTSVDRGLRLALDLESRQKASS